MPISVATLLACRLMGVSLACGINVYATIAVVGLASRLGWVDALPPSLVGLEHWLLIAGASALLLVEIVAAAVPWIEPGWEAVHTVIRPVSALSLTYVGLEGLPFLIRVAVSLIAGTAALGSHATRIGLRLSLPMLRTHRVPLTMAEAILAVVLAVSALLTPSIALASVAVAAGLVLLAGPVFWRAAFFAARAMVARIRGFFVGHEWHFPAEVSERLRAMLPPPETGLPPTRLVRATLNAPAVGAWRNGWLAFDRGLAWFVFRHRFRPRRLPLQRPAESIIRPGLLADTLEVKDPRGDYSILLLKDGPAAEIVAGALQLVIDGNG